MHSQYIMVPLVGGPKDGDALRYAVYDIPLRLTIRDNRTGTIGYYILYTYTRPERTYWYYLHGGADPPPDFRIVGLLIAHGAIPIDSVTIHGEPAKTTA